jgi:hypothetical protein
MFVVFLGIFGVFQRKLKVMRIAGKKVGSSCAYAQSLKNSKVRLEMSEKSVVGK